MTTGKKPATDDEEIGVDMGPAEPHSEREIELARENDRLRGIIERMRSVYGEQYAALRSLFDSALTNSSPVEDEERPSPKPAVPDAFKSRSKVNLLLARFAEGTVVGRMFRILLEHKELTLGELAAMAQTKLSSGAFKSGRALLVSAGAATIEKKQVTLTVYDS